MRFLKRNRRENTSIRKGRIELSSSDYGTLNRLAYLYYLWTDKKITVTGGTRTAKEQAEAMYDNWHYHRNETHYGDQEAEEEIRESYEDSNRQHGGRSTTVGAMTSESKIKRGIIDSSRRTFAEGRLT
jgi:hypothetical protein